jgi:hypothetical protein
MILACSNLRIAPVNSVWVRHAVLVVELIDDMF